MTTAATSPTWTSSTKFEDVIEAATAACQPHAYNLTLAYEFPVAVLESAFVHAQQSVSERWIAAKPAADMYFSHGECFLGDRGVAHVIEELRQKDRSRRALLTLLPMEKLVGSGDEPRPAFVLLQFGLQGDVLYLTAYFRALEVSRFLRINLGEIALHARRVRNECGRSIETLRVFIVAFDAYVQNDFGCLIRPEIDRMDRSELGLIVANKDVERIAKLLEEKRRPASVYEPEGLESLLRVAKLSSKYSHEFTSSLAAACAELRHVHQLRQKISQSPTVEAATQRFLAEIDKVIKIICSKSAEEV